MDKSIVKKIFEQVLIYVAIAIISGAVITFTSMDKGKFEVLPSIQREDGSYLTSIGIKNHKKNNGLSMISLCILNRIEIMQVIANVDYSIDFKKSIISLELIPPTSTATISVITNLPVKYGDIVIQTDEKISFNYLASELPVTTSAIISLITMIVVCAIMFGLVSYLDAKRTQKYEQKSKDRYDEAVKITEKLKNEINELMTKHNDVQKELKDKQKNIKELQIYYLARLTDYKTELNFWKDTLRKFVYQSGEKGMSSIDLFDTVTNMLKTYGTKQNVDLYYDELHYLAEHIKRTEDTLSVGVQEHSL